VFRPVLFSWPIPQNPTTNGPAFAQSYGEAGTKKNSDLEPNVYVKEPVAVLLQKFFCKLVQVIPMCGCVRKKVLNLPAHKASARQA